MKTPPTLKENNFFLPDDLVLQIQLRLLAKSLTRFMGVSKPWFNRISSPSFLDMYHKQSKKNPNILLNKNTIYHQSSSGVVNHNDDTNKWCADWKSFNPQSLSLNNSFSTSCKVYNISVTCLGVVCFLGTRDGTHTQVFLYSLSTKQLLALPIAPKSNFSKGPIVGFGIGYLPLTQSYKVAILFMRNYENIHPFPQYKCQVFEVCNGGGAGSGSWRVVEEDLPYLVDCFHSPTFVEDIIYWEAWSKDKIVSFNIKNDRFGTLSYPNGDSPLVTKFKYLVDLQGKLGLATTSRSIEASVTMVIWKLQDHQINNGPVWEKAYSIPLGGIKQGLKLDVLEPIKPIYLQDDCKEIIMYSKGCLVFYNTNKNTYKVLSLPKDFSPVGVYHESLFSLGAI